MALLSQTKTVMAQGSCFLGNQFLGSWGNGVLLPRASGSRSPSVLLR